MLDLVIVILLLLAALNGWRSGAVEMILSFFGLLIAGYLASMFATPVGKVLHVGGNYLQPIIGFIVCFFVLLILLRMIRSTVKPKEGILRGLDGIIGATLGFLRGGLVLGIVLLLLQLIHLPPERYTENSIVYPIVTKAAARVIVVLKPLLPSGSEKNKSVET